MTIVATALHAQILAIATEIGVADINHNEAQQMRRDRALALQRELNALNGAKQ